jgi:uncharacterized protein YgiM (DUF1202 family)
MTGLNVMRRVKQQLRLAILVLVSMVSLGLSDVYAQDGSGVQATVAPDIVFVREIPGTSAEAIDEFPRGLTLNVLGRENQAGNGGLWVLVTPANGGSTGWVLIDLLNFDGSFVLSSLPIVDPSSTEVPSSATASGDGTAPSTNVTVRAEGLPGQTNQLANLRTGPELTFDIIEQFQANTDAIFVGRNANSVWLYVVIEEQAGWFFSGLVDVDGDVNSLPVVNPDGTAVASGEAVVSTGAGGASAASGGSSFSDISLGVRPGTPFGAPDGRLNGVAEDLGSVLVYCVTQEGYTNAGNYEGGGIVVYRFEGENPGIVLFVAESVIEGAKSSGASGQLAGANGYNLYYLVGNTLNLTGTDSGGDTFVFEWENCNQGGRID